MNFEPSPLQIPEFPSEFLKKKEKPASKIVVLCERMKLQSDSVCPICQ